MSGLFKTTELSYDELLAIYERISKDYQKETQENAQLKSDIKHYRSEIERLERLVRDIKKSCK
jgi:peptidoglycan hydrolase CwlO-like protein